MSGDFLILLGIEYRSRTTGYDAQARNQNRNRSKTAEEFFKDRFNTKSAGLYNQKPVTRKQLSWADVVFVMEDEQRSELAKRFPDLYLQKRILSLDIPDVYNHGNQHLTNLLHSSMKRFSSVLRF